MNTQVFIIIWLVTWWSFALDSLLDEEILEEDRIAAIISIVVAPIYLPVSAIINLALGSIWAKDKEEK